MANSRLNLPLSLWLIADELEDIHSPLSNPAPTLQPHRSLHHGLSPTHPQRSLRLSTQPRKLNQAIKDGNLAKVHATPLPHLLCIPKCLYWLWLRPCVGEFLLLSCCFAKQFRHVRLNDKKDDIAVSVFPCCCTRTAEAASCW